MSWLGIGSLVGIQRTIVPSLPSLRTLSNIWVNSGVSGFGLPLGVFLSFLWFFCMFGWKDLALYGFWINAFFPVWLFPSLVGGWICTWGFSFLPCVGFVVLLVFPFLETPCAFFIYLSVLLVVSVSLFFYIYFLPLKKQKKDLYKVILLAH